MACLRDRVHDAAVSTRSLTPASTPALLSSPTPQQRGFESDMFDAYLRSCGIENSFLSQSTVCIFFNFYMFILLPSFFILLKCFYYHQLISPCLLPLLVRMNESTADALSAISLRRFSPSLSSFVADRHLSSVPEMKVNECIKIDISSYFMHP